MVKRILMLSVAAVLASCSVERFLVPEARVAGQPAPSSEARTEEAGRRDGATSPRPPVTELAPAPRVSPPSAGPDPSARFPSKNALTVAVEAMALKDFLNYVFGELLKVNYVVAEGIPGLDQPVTLNIQAPVSSQALYKLVAETLDSRKIGIVVKDEVYFIVPRDGKGKGNIPIGTGRNPADVPQEVGEIVQMIPLRYGVNPSIERTIRELVDVRIQPDAVQSALFVTGDRAAILKALDVVKLLDQPATRAKSVALLNLTYVSSKELIEQLVTLLENEGIPTGSGRADGKNVALVPLEQLGAVVIFANGPELLERVEFWARQVDKPSQGPSQRYFIYLPKYARATDLGESLVPLLGGDLKGNQSRDTRSAIGAQTTSTTGTMSSSGTSTSGAGGAASSTGRRDSTGSRGQTGAISVRTDDLTLSVDPRSNSLIFYTTGTRYESLLPMIGRLDVPPKQILLEATIAEVTLSGQFAHGVQYAFASNSGKLTGSTTFGLPAGSGIALNYVANLTNNAKLQLSETDGLVKILSKPMLVVRDGVDAHIAVGNDVPTPGSTTSNPTVSTLQVTTVEYRRTGLTLDIRPNVNAQGLVVMQIAQTITDNVPGGSSIQGAPTFFDRAISTEVVARSGQTVLLGGLISDSRTDNSSGLPLIGKIPGLGWLFNSVTKQHDRTELVIMITPRVVETPDEWDMLKGGLERAFEQLKLPTAPAESAAPTDKATEPKSN
jgi:general secretion pathway protein D